jgi:replicative DNA helicase
LRLIAAGLLVVDYLQLMVGAPAMKTALRKSPPFREAIERLAKARVPLIAITQLSRAPEERGGRPRLSDLRERSDWQDADVVAFIFAKSWSSRPTAIAAALELIIEAATD